MVEPVSSIPNQTTSPEKQPTMPAVPSLNINGGMPTQAPMPVGGAQTPTMPDSETGTAVIRQIEWYLGRENLGRDFYLRQRMTPDYWAPLDVLLRFPKMQKLGMTEVQPVARLLREGSTQVVVDDLGLFVRPAWATPMPGVGLPAVGPVQGASGLAQKSTLVLKDVPATVGADIVLQAFKDIPKCPTPESARPEADGSYAVVFGTGEGAQNALEIAADLMIAGKYPIAGHVRFDSPAPGMVPIPNPSRPPYSPPMMLSPLPLQTPYPYNMPSPGYGGFGQSPRTFYPAGGMFPGGATAMYGMDHNVSPGARPMTPSTPGTPMTTQSGAANIPPVPVANGELNKFSQVNGGGGTPSGPLTPQTPGRVNGPSPNYVANGTRNVMNRNHNRNRRMENGSYTTDVNGTGSGTAYHQYDHGRNVRIPHKAGGVKPIRNERGNGVAGSPSAQVGEGGRKGPHGGNGNPERRRGKGRKRPHREETTKQGENVKDASGEGKPTVEPKVEAKISTMYFPPLPGSGEAGIGTVKGEGSGTSTPKRWSDKRPLSTEMNGASFLKETNAKETPPLVSQRDATKAAKMPSLDKDGESDEKKSLAASPSTQPGSPTGEGRKRESLTGGLSYAAILRAKRRNGLSPAGAMTGSPGAKSPKNVAEDEGVKALQEEDSNTTSIMVSASMSPLSSSTTLGENGLSENERRDLKEREHSPPAAKSVAGTFSGDEISQSSVSKAGSTVESSPPSDNDVQSIGSSVPESQESKGQNQNPAPIQDSDTRTGTEKQGALSPSTSVWANKPKAVLEAAPVTPSAKVTAQKAAQKTTSAKVNQKTTKGTPKTGTKTTPRNSRNANGKKDTPRGNSSPVKGSAKGARNGKNANHGDRNASKSSKGGANLGKKENAGDATVNETATKAKATVTPKGAWASGGPKSLAREDKGGGHTSAAGEGQQAEATPVGVNVQ